MVQELRPIFSNWLRTDTQIHKLTTQTDQGNITHLSLRWDHLWSFIKLSCAVQESLPIFANWLRTDTYSGYRAHSEIDLFYRSTFYGSCNSGKQRVQLFSSRWPSGYPKQGKVNKMMTTNSKWTSNENDTNYTSTTLERSVINFWWFKPDLR